MVRAAQVKFLRALADQARSVDAVTFEFAPDGSDELEWDQTRDLRSRLAGAFADKPTPKIVFFQSARAGLVRTISMIPKLSSTVRAPAVQSGSI